MSTDLALQFLETVTQQRDGGTGASTSFDTTALQGLTQLAAEPGRFTAVLPVAPDVQNRYGTLHGGCIATIVDTVGSAALVTVSEKGGVSLNLNTSYLSPAPAGSRVFVEAQVVRVGKRIAIIDVKLTDQASGTLVAQGTHIKSLGESEPRIQWLLTQQGKQAQHQGTQQQAGRQEGEQRQQQQQAGPQRPRSKL